MLRSASGRPSPAADSTHTLRSLRSRIGERKRIGSFSHPGGEERKMRRGIFTLAGAVLLVAATQTVALSQTERGWQDRLNLTDAQKAQLEELQERHRAEAAEARAELIKARAEVQSMMAQQDPDLNALQRAMNRVSELENASRIQTMRNRKACEETLTEEQRATLRSGARRLGTFLFMRDRMGRSRRPTSGHRGFSRPGRGGQSLWGRGRGTQRRGLSRISPAAGRNMLRQGIQRWRGGRSIPPTAQAGELPHGLDWRSMLMRLRNRRTDQVPPATPPPPPPPLG